MYKRLLSLPSLLKKKSFFLFGARAVGKTTLIHQSLKRAKVYDLLHTPTFIRLVKNPSLLEEENTGKQLIVIDEIQKLPPLLDEVHRLIYKGFRFLLTGSSARKLKRSHANLLAGRAWQAFLFPLCSREIRNFHLIQYLNRGGLPSIYNNPDYQEELNAYTHLYLKEEIQQESLTRKLSAFSEFLDVVALSNGQEINYQKLASDLQVSPKTVKTHIEVLNDTLLGFYLPAHTKTKKRKAIMRSKYYLFDIGVTNTLCSRGIIQEKSDLFGKVFEHFIILEVRAYLSYHRKPQPIAYWRSTSQQEVDLVVGNQAAIEIKASDLIQDRHLKGLRAFKEEGAVQKYFMVSLDKEKRKTKDGIHILPWPVFLNQLWKGRIT